ncbi:TrkA family potassium uptake protein [Candidatus Kapaibacterium sp.]
MNKKFCIIGLGNFGISLALYLNDEGAEVMVIEKDLKKVEYAAERVALAVQMDSTEEKSLISLGIKDMDAVIVAIGEDFEASLNTVAILQELGVQKIYARVISPIHERLLKLMNITDLLYPEAEAARHLVNRLLIPGLLESFEISKDFGIFEINTPKYLVGKTLLEANLRKEYNLNLVTVKQLKFKKKNTIFSENTEKYDVVGVIKPDYVFIETDVLVLFGKESDFKDLLKIV